MPATAPRLVILVTVDEPHGAIWGGVVAAPVFQQIARFALQYLEVPPDANWSAAARRQDGHPVGAPDLLPASSVSRENGRRQCPSHKSPAYGRTFVTVRWRMGDR